MDPEPEVRKYVCEAIVLFLESNFNHLQPQLPQIIEYMLACSDDDDDGVALEAGEFWLRLTDEEGTVEVLAQYLPQLIPTLLKRMRYSEFDIILLKGDDDSHVADSDQDVRPHITKSRSMGAAAGDGDDESDDDDEHAEWNLRKCSAAGLDLLSTVYGDDWADGGHALTSILLPLLNEMLISPEWERKESGILGLGAIAEGCGAAMVAHLPALLPYLIQTLSDARPLVRSIACWTISRYAQWVVGEGKEAGILHSVLDEVLKRVLDDNKKVQEAACSALAVIEEETNRDDLLPYLGYILQALAQAFTKYQKR